MGLVLQRKSPMRNNEDQEIVIVLKFEFVTGVHLGIIGVRCQFRRDPLYIFQGQEKKQKITMAHMGTRSLWR